MLILILRFDRVEDDPVGSLWGMPPLDEQNLTRVLALHVFVRGEPSVRMKTLGKLIGILDAESTLLGQVTVNLESIGYAGL